jgi:hypothetical protein
MLRSVRRRRFLPIVKDAGQLGVKHDPDVRSTSKRLHSGSVHHRQFLPATRSIRWLNMKETVSVILDQFVDDDFFLLLEV